MQRETWRQSPPEPCRNKAILAQIRWLWGRGACNARRFRNFPVQHATKRNCYEVTSYVWNSPGTRHLSFADIGQEQFDLKCCFLFHGLERRCVCVGLCVLGMNPSADAILSTNDVCHVHAGGFPTKIPNTTPGFLVWHRTVLQEQEAIRPLYAAFTNPP